MEAGWLLSLNPPKKVSRLSPAITSCVFIWAEFRSVPFALLHPFRKQVLEAKCENLWLRHARGSHSGF